MGKKHIQDDTSEDCLFVNVQAPSNATEDSKLPVWLFIQGGGFGKNSKPNINATGLIEASGHNIVVVDLNYRVGPYGFLVDGDNVPTNNGLRDQRKVMEWVKKYITKFGGDPDHVVLGGASAGAASIAYHLTSYNGEDNGLFIGAAAESPSFATTLTINEAQYWYTQFATRLGCFGSDSVACLQNKTAAEIQWENIEIPFPGGAEAPKYQWEPVIDGEIVPDYLHKSYREGKFIKVPTIFGDDRNGGTVFTPRDTSTFTEAAQFVLNQYPFLTVEQLGEIERLYPNPNKTCPNEGCYWREVSNVYQEVRYMCPSLYVTTEMINYGMSSSWEYIWSVVDREQEAEGLGVAHTREFYAILGSEYVDNAPDSYKPGGINALATPIIQGYWTSFIRSLDPNKYRKPGTAEWTKYSKNNEARLEFQKGGETAMQPIDDGLKERCEFWARIADSMRV